MRTPVTVSIDERNVAHREEVTHRVGRQESWDSNSALTYQLYHTEGQAPRQEAGKEGHVMSHSFSDPPYVILKRVSHQAWQK